MFLSIFLATCRTQNIVEFLDNLQQTAADPASFEVLIKIDEDALDLIDILENYQRKNSLHIKYIASAKLNGYYSLNVGYNELLKISNPETYFCWLLTDEIRMSTPHWDTLLKKYIKFYDDDIFRLKLSVFQLKNYYDFFECLPCPDNYAITTRRWLEITGGWGEFWGPDSWHQCIDYYLGLCKNEFYPYGIWRSIPIFEIEVSGQEAGEGIKDEKQLIERTLKIWSGWTKFSNHAAQENFYRLAQRLSGHIFLNKKKISQYYLVENIYLKKILFYTNENVLCLTNSYYLRKNSIRFMIANKKISLKEFVMSIIKTSYFWFMVLRNTLKFLGFIRKNYFLMKKKYFQLIKYYKNKRREKYSKNALFCYYYDGKKIQQMSHFILDNHNSVLASSLETNAIENIPKIE